MNTGYVKIPVNVISAIRAYADTTGKTSEALTLLTAYLKLRWHEYDGPGHLSGRDRRGGYTAAGAQAIRKVTALSYQRAKDVLQTLLKPPASLSPQPFILETGAKHGLAPVYKFSEWAGPLAYVPAVLWDEAGHGALRKILASPATVQLRLDALCLLLELYARMDYDWLAAPPNRSAYQVANLEGGRGVGNDWIELGCHGQVGDYDLWLVEVDHEWQVDQVVCNEVFGQVSGKRYFAAADLLLGEGLICRIVVAEIDEFRYPLYIHHRGAAEALNQRGIITDLTRRCQRTAEAAGDEDARVIIAEAATNPGTDFYYCLSDGTPNVYVLLMPCVHAPTPENVSGLDEVAARTSRIGELLKDPAPTVEPPRPKNDTEDDDPFGWF